MRKSTNKKMITTVFLFIILFASLPTINGKKLVNTNTEEFNQNILNENVECTVKNPIPTFEGYKHINVQNDYALILSTFEDDWQGLRVFDVDFIENMQSLQNEVNPNHEYIYDMNVYSDFLYLDTSDQLLIYDVSDSENIEYMNAINVSSFMPFDNFVVEKDILTCLDRGPMVWNGYGNSYYKLNVHNYNISDMSNIVLLGNYTFQDWYYQYFVARTNDALVIRAKSEENTSKLVSFNADEKLTNPTIKNSIVLDGNIRKIKRYNDILCLAIEDRGLTFLDLETLTIIAEYHQFDNSGPILKMVIDNNILFTASKYSVAALDIKNLNSISLILNYSFIIEEYKFIMDIDFEDNILYIARFSWEEEDALVIFDFSSLKNPVIVYPEEYITTFTNGFQFNVVFCLLFTGTITLFLQISKFKKKEKV